MQKAFNTNYSLQQNSPLDHLSQQLVDSLLPITRITPFNKMLELSLPPPTSRITQFERPQKVIRLLEIGSHSENLMNQILHTFNTVFSKGISDEGIVGEGNSGTVDFTVAALVDEVADRFEIGFPIGDVGLDDLEHFLGCFGEFDEDSVIDLEETEKLQYFSGLGSNLVDTGKH